MRGKPECHGSAEDRCEAAHVPEEPMDPRGATHKEEVRQQATFVEVAMTPEIDNNRRCDTRPGSNRERGTVFNVSTFQRTSHTDSDLQLPVHSVVFAASITLCLAAYSSMIGKYHIDGSTIWITICVSTA